MNKDLRLMIVDDNARTRSALRAYLSSLGGMRVIAEAADGQDAIATLQTHTPDLVLMDCQMPGMGGPEATRILKRRWPHIKVVILTIHADCQAEAGLAGADAVLLKGCSWEQMVGTFRSVVGK